MNSFKKLLVLTFLPLLMIVFGCTKNQTEAGAAASSPTTSTPQSNDPNIIDKAEVVSTIPPLNGLSFNRTFATISDDHLLMFSNGTAYLDLEVSKPGKNSLFIKGAGGIIKNEPVKITVSIDDQKVENIDFSNPTAELKQIKINSKSKKVKVGISFTNDYANFEKKEDRNFLLYSVKLNEKN